MSGLIEKDREPSSGELRWFGLLFLGFWTLIAGVIAYRTGRATVPLALVAAAAVLCAVYYAVPVLRRPLLRGWVLVTHPIGWLGSHLALGIFYFLVMTPLALVMRISGRDALERRLDATRATYWIRRRATSKASDYWNQY